MAKKRKPKEVTVTHSKPEKYSPEASAGYNTPVVRETRKVHKGSTSVRIGKGGKKRVAQQGAKGHSNTTTVGSARWPEEIPIDRTTHFTEHTIHNIHPAKAGLAVGAGVAAGAYLEHRKSSHSGIDHKQDQHWNK